MPDTALFSLVAKCAAASCAKDDAADRLKAANETDSDLIALDAFEAADVELGALYLALAITPSHTLEGALAKAAALPDDDDLAAIVSDIVKRFAEGLQKAKDRPVGMGR